MDKVTEKVSKVAAVKMARAERAARRKPEGRVLESAGGASLRMKAENLAYKRWAKMSLGNGITVGYHDRTREAFFRLPNCKDLVIAAADELVAAREAAK